MKTVALLLALPLAACGATQQPLLANAPRPNVAAAAGVTAAAAAALTLASPSSVQQKPEDKINEDTRPQEVNESVPSDVFDRLDAQSTGSDASTKAASAPAAKKKKAAPARLPSPKEAVEQTQPSAADVPAN